MYIGTRVELECSYGAGDGQTRSGVASMPKERSGRPRLDQSCDWEKYGYDRSMSFILWESSIGHLAKSTFRANTVLSWKVNIREVLHMLLCVSEDFLRGVPESLVHNVIIDFAHRGNIVRSNYWDRSNPKNDVVIIFWVWPKP